MKPLTRAQAFDVCANKRFEQSRNVVVIARGVARGVTVAVERAITGANGCETARHDDDDDVACARATHRARDGA
jgi:hypothetical protein